MKVVTMIRRTESIEVEYLWFYNKLTVSQKEKKNPRSIILTSKFFKMLLVHRDLKSKRRQRIWRAEKRTNDEQDTRRQMSITVPSKF